MPRIRIYDNETTGLEPTDKVCELGWTDLDKVGGDWIVGETGSFLCRVDAMPARARAIHHIAAEETWPFAPFDPATLWDRAREDKVDVIAAHNLQFDQMFWGEFQLPAICTLKSARRVWPDAPAHGNGVLRYWLADEGLIAPDHSRCHPAHRAGPDTYMTAHILKAALAVTTAAQMVAWTKEPLLQPRCPIGDPWRDKPWPEVDAGFVRWITTKQGMDADTVWNAQRELDRRTREAVDA